MNRMFARIATLAVAAPFATAMFAGGAQAATNSVHVPGCFGAGVDSSTIVCDLTLTVQTPEPGTGAVYVKACVSACSDIGVPTVTTTGPTSVCWTYTGPNGQNPQSGCADDFTTVTGPPLLHDLIRDLLSSFSGDITRNLVMDQVGCGSAVCTY